MWSLSKIKNFVCSFTKSLGRFISHVKIIVSYQLISAYLSLWNMLKDSLVHSLCCYIHGIGCSHNKLDRVCCHHHSPWNGSHHPTNTNLWVSHRLRNRNRIFDVKTALKIGSTNMRETESKVQYREKPNTLEPVKVRYALKWQLG